MRGPVFRGSLPLKNIPKPSRAYFSRQPQSQVQEETNPTSDRIHILGLGNIGRLFAHGLASKPNPRPITLLLHRGSLLQEWKDAGERITLTTLDGIEKSGNYDVEILNSQNSTSKEPISNLIVTTKAPKTLQAMSPLKDRLSPASTILFTQNGMGTADEVSSSLFPDPASRPVYTNGIVSHGVFSTGPFASVHAGEGDIVMAHLGMEETPTSQSLLQQMTDSPLLNASTLSPFRGLIAQLLKLVSNATINPLTVLFDCKNGDLFTPDPIQNLARLLLIEISPVLVEHIYNVAFPHLWNSKQIDFRLLFSCAELETHMEVVAERTAENFSSMLQDVRAGRETEIDYINGWIVKRGLEQGRNMSVNQKVIEMVKSKQRLKLEDVGQRFGELTQNKQPLGVV